MKELEEEIKRVELLYSKLEKTKNGTSDDWYYSGMLKGLRKAQRIVKKLTITVVSCQREQLSHYNDFVNMQYHGVSLDDSDIDDFNDWLNCY